MERAYHCFIEGKERSKIGDLCQEADLERALLLIVQQRQDFHKVEDADSSRDQMMTRMMEFIQSHLTEVCLTDVAELLHFSPAYTSRLIRKQTGFSFQTLLLTMRLDAAARQLRETELSVDQIAASVGLTGKSNFYEKFRNIYGVNPGEYRKGRQDRPPF